MNKVFLIDGIAVVTCILGILLLLLLWSRSKYPLLKSLIVFILLFYCFFEGFMFLEWADYSHSLEAFEDLSGALIPILWLVIFYMLIEQVNIRKLENSEESLKLVIQGANSGLFDWNIKKDHLIVNERWAEMIGYTIDEIVPSYAAWESLIHPEDMEETRIKLNNHLVGGSPFYKSDFRMRHRDGSWRWISARGKIVDRDAKDLPIRMAGIHLDITSEKLLEYELKQSIKEYLAVNEELQESFNRIHQFNAELEEAKEKAEESDRLKTAFLGNLSHEIRTPMNGILGFIDLIKNPDLKSSKRNLYLQVIEKSGERLMNLINDLIDISIIEEGQIKIQPKPISVNSLIDEIFLFFQSKVEGKGLTLICHKELKQQDSIIFVDKDRISQVLSNLLDNAIKFTHSGQIIIGYVRKESEFEFYVRDTGIGISAEMKATIFERFRQIDTSLSRGYEGSGLGLAISKAIIELHGGKLRVDSNIGEGSTFYFTLPIGNDSNVKPKLIQPEADINYSMLKARKILVAEDDEISFLFLKEILEREQMTVIHAKDGYEAVKMVDLNPDIGILLMDIKMPRMSGLDAIKIIKAKHTNIPIIAQTAYAQIDDKEKMLLSGCDAYISKPIEREDLLYLLYKHIINN